MAPRPHFSLRDEARSTGFKELSFNTKLRNHPISFVRASKSAPENIDELQDEFSKNEEPISPVPEVTVDEESSNTVEKDTAEPKSVSSNLLQSLEENGSTDQLYKTADSREPSPLPFIIDTTGTPTMVLPHLAKPFVPERVLDVSDTGKISRRDSTSSNSSDEVVFKGRAKVNIIDDDPLTVPSRHSALDLSKKPVPTTQKDGYENRKDISWDNSTEPWVSRSTPGIGWLDTQLSSTTSKSRATKSERRSQKHKTQDSTDEDDAVVQDYLENLRAQDEHALHENSERSRFLLRNLSLDDHNDGLSESHLDIHRVIDESLSDADGWDATMLDAFDNASTSDGLDSPVKHVLRRRHRADLLQYLVVYEGHSISEARWVWENNLTMEQDIKLVHLFEASSKERADKEYDDSDSSTDDDDQWEEEEDDEDEEDDDDDDDDDDEDNDSDDDSDDDDLIQRKIDQMTDEKIALLLAKQEELGLGSNELLLFDGDDGNMDDSDFDVADQKGAEKHVRRLLREYTNLPLRPTKSNRRSAKRSEGKFPPASLMADVLEQDPYNGFDIMDFDRPSLKKKKNGRNAVLPFELSDEELRSTLQRTWEADRKKKATKRQEREKLRALGLLGKQNKFKADPKPSYKDGITMGELKDEIRQFLASTYDNHALPPMDKNYRRMTHEVARVFNIQSKSNGSGKNRFTTLIKTHRTLAFDEATFRRAERQVSVRFFPRSDQAKSRPSRAQGTGGISSFSYRDGDIVGFGAAEIGVENRGRAMLEKMGWSSGTALGALHNKGILQPVSHVVKTTKAGLG